MGNFLNLLKDEASTLLRDKKNLINLLILGILILGLFLGIDLARREQIFKSRATAEVFDFSAGRNMERRNNQWVALRNDISFNITSPWESGSSGGSFSGGTDGSEGTEPKANDYGWYCKDNDTIWQIKDGEKSFYCDCSPNATIADCKGTVCKAKSINDGSHTTDAGCYDSSSSSGGSSSMDASQACEAARKELNKAAGGTETQGMFSNSTCDEVKNKVCNNCSLFVPPSSIRDALCPGTCKTTSLFVKTAYAQEACIDDSGCGDLPQYCEGNDTWQCTGGYCGDGTCQRTCNKVNGNPAGCGGNPPPADESWCTAGRHVCGDIGTPQGSCTKDGKSCTRFETYQCTTSSGVNYCGDKGAGTSGDYECRNCSACSAGYNEIGDSTVINNMRNGNYQVDNQIVGSNLQPYTGTGLCGYKYYQTDPNNSTLPNGDVCAKIVFGELRDQNACRPITTKIYIDPNPANSGASVTVIATAGRECSTGIHLTSGAGLTSCSPSGGSTCSGGNPKDSSACWWKWTCTAGTAGNYNASFNASGTNCASNPTPYTIGGSVPPSAPPGGSITTTRYRMAESLADLNNAAWVTYTAGGVNIDNFRFADATAGNKFIFVQFEGTDANGATVTTNSTTCPKCQAQVRLLGDPPAVTGCSLGFEGTNTVLNISGRNFGSTKGSAKSNDTSLTIRQWNNTSIQAVFPNAPTGEEFPVSVTNSDNQEGPGRCSAITQLSLGARVFCRAPSSGDTDNVDLVLAEAFAGGKKTKQKVRIDKDGVIGGLNQKLESGKKYKISLKAPKSLRKTVEFTAGDGTTNVPNFILPVGDISPADGGDGSINASDKSELNRQWIIAGSGSGRTGDFNSDGRVNSIDWACMRYDFGSVDDAEPVAPAAPAIGVGSTVAR
ncbi:hypothetical protein HYU94_03895 [Candidatus Daviesbacteria bacterium]|nr:hypothetical protein [Candidatus Daviesbacteria bacterium]